MLSVSSSPFGRLPQRPPTPPREVDKAVDDAIALLDDSNEVERALNGQSVLKLVREQSDDSPPSSNGSSGSSNTAKKVGFSLTTATIEPDTSRLYPTPGSRGSRKSLSSRNSKPTKSILKPTALPPTPDTTESKRAFYSPDIPGSFSTMLQSIVQQLAAPARSVKLDAYLALNGVLQTYDGVPDAEAMAEHSDAMMQFLTRDLAWKNEEGNLDVQIVTQSLKLTCALLFDLKLRETLDDDFKNFLTDRSLAVIEEPDMPKAVVKAHMYLLAQPGLRSPNMTPAKIERLLSALKTIDERCSGNNVIATRLVIYTRMFDRDPHTTLARINDWLEHLLHGMLSSIKEVRLRAIETCTRAGMVFGQQPHAAKALHEIFETEVEDGMTYLDFFKTQLLQMISEKEIGPCVPQIWGAVILFFRSKRLPLEKWTKLKSWTSIIQKCLNSSDIAIRYQAILAWNKMVFVIMPSSTTTTPIMAMLKVPITTGLEKKGIDKYSRQVRHYALDSYCNLLHYAFRPGLSNEEIDRAWEVYVDGALSSIDTSTTKRGFNLCRVLHGLLNGHTGVWNVNAAPEQVVIHSADLPKLDPRWVRSRLDKLLKVLEPIVAADMWSAAGGNEALDVTWYYLMRAIADAGNQEVKTSIELEQALALLVNLFRRLWYGYGGLPQDCDRSPWLKKYFARLDTIITALGSGPCTEEILAAADNDTIEVAPTPSNKPKRQYGPTQSFLGILFAQFYSPPDAMRIDDHFEDAAWAILKRLTSSQPGSTTKLALLDNCLKFASSSPKSHRAPLVKERLWSAAARVAMQLLRPESPITGASESQSAGHGLRHALNVLTAGLSLPGTAAATYDLYNSILEAARGLAGDGGVVLALVEPFSKALTSDSTTISVPDRLELACDMLTTAPWPRSRQDMDSAHRALWGVSMASLRSPAFDPYNSLYTLMNSLSASLYDAVDTDERLSAISQSFFTAAVDFLDRSPISQLASALRRIQACFALWIRDASRKTDQSEDMSRSVCDLWSHLVKLLGKLPTTDNALLKAIDQLVVAGFTSPHRNIVNRTIIFWNDTFGTQQSLEYPPELEKILRARAIDAEISLPSLSDSIGEAIVSLPAFFESQSEAVTSLPVPQSKGSEKGHLLASPFKPTARNVLVKSPLQKAFGVSSPARHNPRRSVSTTPKARLRHDDSQIQFEHIVDSSPLPQEDESQLLTEHQKEVKARQHLDAQLFPAFSSSPQAQSTALQRNVPKRLDFTSQLQVLPEDSDAQGTPTALPDNLEPNDDVPSSPTPSSKGNSQIAIDVDVDDNEAEEEIADDPPSSPPRVEHAAEIVSIEKNEENKDDDHGNDVDGSTTEVMDFALTNGGVQPDQDIDVAPAVPDIELHDAQQPEALTELHSDTDLPTIQLQLEEEAASGPLDINSAAPEPSTNEGPAVFDNDEPSQDAVVDEDDEVTRIENSFIVTDSAETPGDSQSTDGSQKSTRKRKRTTSTKFTTKKQRKRESPLKRIASYIWGQSQQEVDDDDDEDIGEEIVVASSQRMLSRSPDQVEPVVEALSIPITPMPEPEVEEPVVVVKTEEEEPQPPVRRARGRPRKSETPVVVATDAGPEKRLKRKASTLSSSSAASDEQTSSSIVKATPALSKARKARKDQDAGESLGRRTRKVAAVVINRDEVVESQVLEKGHVEEEEVGAVEDAGEPATVVDEGTTRAIATPRGILNRMRDALADLGGLILGSQEERQFDDLLFEFRREVHEASRRGRST